MENSTYWEGGGAGINPSSTWQRFSVSYTFSNSGDSNEVDPFVVVPAGCGLQLWGWQFEEASSAGPYVLTAGYPRAGLGGVTSFTTSSLSAGTHPISASFGGDSQNSASTSPVLSQVVNKNTPTLSVSCSAATYGQTYSCTATVSGDHDGTISLTNNGSAWGSGTPDSGGNVTISATGAAAGSWPIVATYSGDSSYNGATANTTLVEARAVLTVTANSQSMTYVIHGAPSGWADRGSKNLGCATRRASNSFLALSNPPYDSRYDA